MENRQIQRKDESLYTQEKLDAYNAAKNQKTWERPKHFNFA